MKCKRCLTKIDETEIYCEDCKQKIKQENQLNQLIDENLELNELEKTKEIEVLHPLNEESFVSPKIKEELKDIVKIDEIEEKNNNKKIIIIISVILSLIISVLLYLLIFKNNNKEIEEEKINYKSVLNDYGNLLKKTVVDYIEINNEVPSWNILNKNTNYKKHKIICNIHHIYEDGSIYLNGCKIDGKDIKYSFGNKKQQEKGKEINIYINETENNSFVYNEEKSDNLVGTITCKTKDCQFIDAYENYALIKELDEFYLYNYIRNDITFGPFDISNIGNHMLVYDNVLYGILYNKNNKQNIYSIKTDKTFNDINGNLFFIDNNFDPKLMYKYGYVIFETDKGMNFVSLNTGKVNYTISETINNFIESKDNKFVYITTLNSINSKKIIYNSNGKKLFDGKEFNSFNVYDNKIIVHDDYKFFVYDLNLKLLLTSKAYENILNFYDDVFVVINNSNIEIVDIDDNSVIKFDFKWDDNYIFDSNLSTFNKIDQDFEITIVIKDTIENINYNLIYNSRTKNIKILK